MPGTMRVCRHPHLGWTCRLAVILTPCCLAGCAQPQQEGPAHPQFRVESFRWIGQVAPGQIVEVINHYGNIRFRSSDDGTLELSAMIQKLGPQAGQVRVEARERAGGAIIRVGPTSEQGTPTGWFRGRVDITVLLPPGVSTHAHTLDGLIEVKGVTGDVVATTADGDIHAVRPRHLRATTRRGQIHVVLDNRKYDGPLFLESIQGDITVQVSQEASLNIQAHTTGPLIANFSKKASMAVQRAENSLQVTMGSGTNSLHIKSESGRIELVDVGR